MAAIYTHGMWHVKEGREEEFVAAWQAFAQMGMDIAGAQGVRLIQDLDRKNIFFSFGGWDTVEKVQAFREDQAFQAAVDKMSEMLDRFEIFTGAARVDLGEVN